MNDYRLERCGVVGLGYVGLPLAVSMVEAGYEVVGVDKDEDCVDGLRRGNSHVTDVKDATVQSAIENGFTPTTEYHSLSDVDTVSICVPTPMRKTGTPDLSFVIDAVETLVDVIPRGVTVVLESTVYPGATEELVADTMLTNGWVVGEDIFIGFSPERIDPGNEEYGPTEIPKVVGGVTEECGDRVEALYKPVFDDVVRVDTATEAELVKLLENTFRAVNIGLINELTQIAYEFDVDIWNVIDAAATKPFGYMPFYPGPGLGGHCLPVDPIYLSWKANKQGIETRFIDLADRVNREMPHHVTARLAELLNDAGIPLPEADIFVLGVTYKADVSDTRESPALPLIRELEEKVNSVTYHDPYVPDLEVGTTTYESAELTSDRLAGSDCAVVLTDHSSIDIETVVSHAPRVFDTRNATADYKLYENIYRL